MSAGPVIDRPLSVAALAHRAGVFVQTPTGECFTLTPHAARDTLLRLEEATQLAEAQAAASGNVVQGNFRRLRPFVIWRQQRQNPRRHPIAVLRLLVTVTLAPVLIAALVAVAVMGVELVVGDAALRDALPLCLLAAVIVALGLTWLAVPLLLEPPAIPAPQSGPCRLVLVKS